jgi:hypothetical protein
MSRWIQLAVLISVPGIALSAAPAHAQSTADSLAIRQAALDYIEGWYEGNGDRMAAAVHEGLAKRIVSTGERGGLGEMGASELINDTRQGGGSDTPAHRRRTDVRILDIFGKTASVRVDAGSWIDYMHMARIDGTWKIINVLWEPR